MSQTANDVNSSEDPGWAQARNQLFRMIMEGRSFSGHERNCMFLNTGGERFATISGISGMDFLDDARCIAVSDWDGDGDQDLWISNRNAPRLRLMRNNGNWNNHFLSIGLEGNGETTNRDAIGARVEIVLAGRDSENGKRLLKTLRAGEGFLSQSSKWLHFGLGESDSIEQIIVAWPGGEKESFAGLQADKRYRLLQGHSEAAEIPSAHGVVSLLPQDQPLPAPTRISRVALQVRLPMPSLQYRSQEDKQRTERFESGHATVVNLWAGWCRPCVEELTELNRRSDELSAAGIRVLSLSATSAGDTSETSDDDRDLMAELKYSHPWGFISESEIDILQQLHHHLFFLRKSFPLPMTFFVDAQGRLSTIYRGPVTVDQLLVDANRTASDYHLASKQAACLPGSTIEHRRVQQLAEMSETHTRYLVASSLEGLGRYKDAIEHFEILTQADRKWVAPLRHLARLYLSQNHIDQALEIGKRGLKLEPNDARIHNTLALIYSRQKQQSKSEFHFREAIRLDPEFAEAHNNLGSLLAGLGKLADAETHFQKAVEIDDEFAEAHTNLGSVYAAKRDVPSATEHYLRAIEIDPTYVDAHNNLGSIYASTGQFEKAIQYYQQAIAIDNRHADARRNLQRAKKLLSTQNAKQNATP